MQTVKRFTLLKWLFYSGFFVLVLSLAGMQLFQGAKFGELSRKNCIKLLPQPGARGRILDRNGAVLAGNVLSYDVMVLPQKNVQLENILRRIAPVLNSTAKELRSNFTRGVVAPFIPVAVARNISLQQAIVIEEIKMDTPGVIVQPHPVRSYPEGKLAAHVLGYLNEIDHWRLSKLAEYGYTEKDTVGYSGVEEKYDYYLQPSEGGVSVEVDHRGRVIRIIGFKPPANGRDIRLTLDAGIQRIAEQALAGRKGCVVIIEPQSGEILALASSPAFDPQAFVSKDTQALRSFLQDNEGVFLNRAIGGAYAPGSVFKLVTAAAALETGKTDYGKVIDCRGSLKLGKEEFNCSSVHGIQDLKHAIAHSCNIYFYNMGILLGGQNIHDYAFKFGYGRTCGVELPYESAGVVPEPLWKRIYKLKRWFDGDSVNFSIGQGDLLVTPLQVARMMAVFANGGNLVNPYIVKTIDGVDIRAGRHKKSAKVPVSGAHLAYLKESLRMVVSENTGTAHILSGLSVAVAGKTGTAQASGGKCHAWFCGFFPYDNPRYVICSFLENGGSGYQSSVMTKEIIVEMANKGMI
ncbi:MAG: penicillin-binding protein 2 [Candidatus Omnitrophota bacterium]|jgi:penicillin-binding protein 2